MKQVNIQFSYDDERLEALRIYLAEGDSTIEDELTSALDAVYKKTVPSQVRAFLDKRSQTEPTKPKGKPSGAGVNASKGTNDKIVRTGNKSGPRGFLSRCVRNP